MSAGNTDPVMCVCGYEINPETGECGYEYCSKNSSYPEDLY